MGRWIGLAKAGMLGEMGLGAAVRRLGRARVVESGRGMWLAVTSLCGPSPWMGRVVWAQPPGGGSGLTGLPPPVIYSSGPFLACRNICWTNAHVLLWYMVLHFDMCDEWVYSKEKLILDRLRLLLNCLTRLGIGWLECLDALKN